MRKSTIVMIAFAVLFGLLAVFVAQSWLNSQAEQRMRSLESNKKPSNTATIVVASKPLRFGNELTAGHLSEVEWPGKSLPAGAFAKIADVVNGSAKRVVLTAIEANEPILASKITGPGQRATLSAAIADGMRAITIRVNDVEGVAGFVLPGDRVDVALTRQKDKEATTDVVLQNIKVLAIDQTADERNDKPSVAKAVTLEVDTGSAQKLALAASIGTLSLMLRKAGEIVVDPTRRITLSDLLGEVVTPAVDMKYATIKVHRPAKFDDYSVPVEKNDNVATTDRRRSVQ